MINPKIITKVEKRIALFDQRFFVFDFFRILLEAKLEILIKISCPYDPITGRGTITLLNVFLLAFLKQEGDISRPYLVLKLILTFFTRISNHLSIRATCSGTLMA